MSSSGIAYGACGTPGCTDCLPLYNSFNQVVLSAEDPGLVGDMADDPDFDAAPAYLPRSLADDNGLITIDVHEYSDLEHAAVVARRELTRAAAMRMPDLIHAVRNADPDTVVNLIEQMMLPLKRVNGELDSVLSKIRGTDLDAQVFR